MEIRKRLLLVLLVLATLALAATPASARATRTTYTAEEFICVEGPPQRMWFSANGTMLHIRGQSAESVVLSSNPLVQGTNHLLKNMDLNLSTGEGHAYGTFSTSPEAVDGTWDGHFTIRFSPTSFSGSAAGRGSGDLAGQHVAIRFSALDPGDPDNPCGATSADLATGVIHNPHGD